MNSMLEEAAFDPQNAIDQQLRDKMSRSGVLHWSVVIKCSILKNKKIARNQRQAGKEQWGLWYLLCRVT